MVRVFYIVLYAATIAAAASHWSRWKGTEISWAMFGTRSAQAQQPQVDPNYPTQPARYVGGVANPTSNFALPPGATPSEPATRPQAWPNARPLFDAPTAAAQPPTSDDSQSVSLEDTRILARVGSVDVVLALEIVPAVNDLLSRNADRIPSSQLEQVREQLIRQRLEQAIQTKCLLAEARSKVPEAGFKQITDRMRTQFDTVEVPNVMAKLGLKTTAELDAHLRKNGGSLDRERRQFVERTLAISWVQQQVKKETPEFTPDQMLEYYNTHSKDFEHDARARWQQLSVRFDRFPTKEAAFYALAAAGNQLIGGADFAAVARQMSQEPAASEGGNHDWTHQGSLSSDAIDQAIFSLPVGQLSPILEDKQGYHIVRVVEREDAGKLPFPEAQAEIRKKLTEGIHDTAVEDYVTELRKRTRVTTIYDESNASPHVAGPQDLPVNPYTTALPSR